MIVATVVAVRLAVAASASVAPIVVGDWQGGLSTGAKSLRVVVHLSEDKDGKLTGTMDSPDQGATGIALSSVNYAKTELHLAIETIGAAYEGKLDTEKHQIVGVWKQGGAALPLTLSPVGN
jgi:hypothetical protein